MKQIYRVALAGNPNCGKTTVFNALTGARQHIGNYPGVTVERKTGHARIEDLQIEFIDLPGIYSLSSSSPEEKIAFTELLNGEIDLILNIVDSSNPQRNLYLTAQLAELRIPTIMVFNMIDDAVRNGLKFNINKMSLFFNAPIITTVGTTGKGIGNLKQKIHSVLTNPGPIAASPISYGPHADEAIHELTAAVEKKNIPGRIPPRYFAIKLLENDEFFQRAAEHHHHHREGGLHTEFYNKFRPLSDALLDPEIQELAAQLRQKMASRHGVANDTFIADCRYGYIAGACREAISISNERRHQLSDSIDKVLTNRFLGLPIFFGIMFLVFAFTFWLADPMMGWIESGFGALAGVIETYWPEGKLELLKALITEGIIGGVGGVVVFLPNILLLFLAIAFLEGTGYMARAAFIMDGFMHRFKLHGKSFIPMLLGFGCTVPAIMGTRTIESERDRMTTIMVLPLMSCGARMPIYALIIPAFFALQYQALVMFLIYVIGIVMALVMAMLLKSTLFKGEDEVFVMELPPYRMPTLKSIIIHMGERGWIYLKKAGTLILAASILLFIINTFPKKSDFSKDYDAMIGQVQASTLSEEERSEKIANLEHEQRQEELEYSIAGRIGRGMEVVMKPLGFDWRVSSALIGAFAAKELFVSQLGILFAVGDVDLDEDDTMTPLRQSLIRLYTPLQAFCIMIFCLLSIPCMATVAVVRRETASWKLTFLQMGGLTLLAYVMTLIIYQCGLLLNIGTQILII
jgi:ferrous iron transport protein B